MIDPPREIDFLLTSECNLRCKHCHMWMNTDSDRSLTLEEKKSVIRQFAALNRKGRVVFCGGELMLRKNEFYELTVLCNELGVLNLAVTNGALIDDKDCKDILSAEPDMIVFSVDSHQPEVHDWIRGQAGAFDRAVESIRILLRGRNQDKPKKTRIYLSQVLMEKNIGAMKEFIAFSRDLGVDGVRFQPLLPTFSSYSKVGKDSFFEKGFFRERGMAFENLDDIKSVGLNDGFVLNTQEDFQWMEESVRLRGGDTEAPQCGAFYRTIYLDQEGNYSLCPNRHLFSSRVDYPGRPGHPLDSLPDLGNFREVGLEEFWYGRKASEARRIMSGCKRICGITPELRR